MQIRKNYAHKLTTILRSEIVSICYTQKSIKISHFSTHNLRFCIQPCFFFKSKLILWTNISVLLRYFWDFWKVIFLLCFSVSNWMDRMELLLYRRNQWICQNPIVVVSWTGWVRSSGYSKSKFLIFPKVNFEIHFKTERILLETRDFSIFVV